MKTAHVSDFKYGCAIILHRLSFHASDGKLMHYYTNFTFEQYSKWGWYFRYRQALIQVQYPKQFVELRPFKFDYIPKEEEIKKRLKNKLTSAKAKRTEWNRKLGRYKASWNSLFPIEDDPNYQNALLKIQEKEQSIIDLQNQIDELCHGKK